MQENAIITIISLCFLGLSLAIIRAQHPIFSVLGLVVLFLLASVFLLVLGLEFMALAFAMVYVGAIAILFLFVVMLLDIKVVRRPWLFKTVKKRSIYLFGAPFRAWAGRDKFYKSSVRKYYRYRKLRRAVEKVVS